MSRTLFDTKVREESGSQTHARYQFQTHFGILKLCELHEENDEDYSLLLDQFDDVVAIRPSIDGPVHHFFQVKAKSSGNWTIDALSKNKKGAVPPASIIAKLYYNAVEFEKETGSINFVSNAGYSAKLKDGSKIPAGTKKIDAIQLHESEIGKIHECLDPDFPKPRDPKCEDILVLHSIGLGTTDQQIFVLGRLSMLLEKFGIGSHAPVRALYEALYSDLSAKAASGGTYRNDDELIAAKAVTRVEIERALEKVAATPRFVNLWPIVESELNAKDWKSIRIIRLQNRCLDYITKRAMGQFTANRLSEVIRETLPSFEDLPDDGEIMPLAESALSEIGDIDLSDSFGLAAAIVETTERLSAIYGR